MLRSVGSILFGLAADRYGRKWPFIINNVLFIILELGTGFCSTYNQFLGVRALFGIAMGGLYGNAAATGMSISGTVLHLRSKGASVGQDKESAYELRQRVYAYPRRRRFQRNPLVTFNRPACRHCTTPSRTHYTSLPN
jgi:hypothetical protein